MSHRFSQRMLHGGRSYVKTHWPRYPVKTGDIYHYHRMTFVTLKKTGYDVKSNANVRTSENVNLHPGKSLI